MTAAVVQSGMLCNCGKPFIRHAGTISTLVGYSSPPGHDHDDNCKRRTYFCEDGHETTVHRRNSCPTCDWKGKATCPCHPGTKVDAWPEPPVDSAIRVSGDVACQFCRRLYREHPFSHHRDWQGEPWLHVRCDGQLLKL